MNRKQIFYKKGYKYRLNKQYSQMIPIKPTRDINTPYISLNEYGNLVIKQGYAWDGPSGPSIDTKSFMRGSLVHDALYQLMAEGYLTKTYRNKADKLLKRICLEDGMWKFRASYVYWAVNKFGSSHLKIEEIEIAP